MAGSLRAALTVEAPMHTLTAFSTVVLAGLLATACDDGKSAVVAPTTVNASAVSADVRAEAPVVDPDSQRGCRGFTIPVQLTVRAGELDVSLTNITMRFEDGSGIPVPQTTPPAPLAPPAPVPTTPAPVPTTQFGSELMAARSVRTIPLSVPIGCTTNPRGTVIVVVGTRDGRGRTGSIEVRTRVS
jgi:hypothetical protein